MASEGKRRRRRGSVAVVALQPSETVSKATGRENEVKKKSAPQNGLTEDGKRTTGSLADASVVTGSKISPVVGRFEPFPRSRRRPMSVPPGVGRGDGGTGASSALGGSLVGGREK